MASLNESKQAVSSKPSAAQKPKEDPELANFREQLEHGDLNGLREYLHRTRETRDWQDRIYVFKRVIDRLPESALHFACENEPNAADLALICTAYYADLAWKRRGSGTCDKIEEKQWIGAAEAVRAALLAVEASIKLDPDDPTSRIRILPAVMIFGQLRPTLHQFFDQILEVAPDCADAYSTMANALSKRWYGSHEEAIAIARKGLSRATPGSDIAGALFVAHERAKGYLEYFDKDIAAAAKYINNPDVGRELTEAFDKWTGPGYVPRRSSVAHLKDASQWFWALSDRERMEKAKSLIEVARRNAGQIEEVEDGATDAEAASDGGSADQAKKCIAFISFGATALREKQAPKALQAFLTAAKHVKFYQLDASLEALAHVHIALACGKLGDRNGSRNALEKGLSIADGTDFSPAPVKVVRLMADALEELDTIRATKFLELLIASSEDSQDPLKMASLLRRMGSCYNRAGLRDHAAIPLRAAVKIYRSSPADPSLPAVLLDLGNALRKTSPGEAEALYREAAELDETQMNLVSAASAWVNLGVLCSEQGRFSEALELYQRVLSIREKTPNTPASRIASVLNNMAGVYRRMRRFDEAHAAIDRAIRMVKPDEPSMPSYYGTRGEIFLDGGGAERSLEWIGKAISIREKQTSSDREALAKNYEKEIEALERLGRNEEAEQPRIKLAELRATIESTPKTEAGSSASSGIVEGAVFVELPFGASRMTPKLHQQISDVASALSEKIREGLYGRFSGKVTVPEHVTLIFYGSNAELLFMAIEPILTAEKICAGARVLIQQNGVVREQMVSTPHMSVN